MYKSPLCYLVFLLMVFFINSCTSAGQTRDNQNRKQVYIDANLLFEISYPEEWARAQRPISLSPLSKQTTTWRINQEHGEDFLLELSILSLPAELNPYGYIGMENIIKEQNAELIIHTREDIAVPAGPTKKLAGKTPRSTYELWLFLGDQRHYIISCSTATNAFEQHQKQFQQIVDSFITLD